MIRKDLMDCNMKYVETHCLAYFFPLISCLHHSKLCQFLKQVENRDRGRMENLRGIFDKSTKLFPCFLFSHLNLKRLTCFHAEAVSFQCTVNVKANFTSRTVLVNKRTKCCLKTNLHVPPIYRLGLSCSKSG